MSAHVLWIRVLGIHPHVKGTSTWKLLVWALSAITINQYASVRGGLPSSPAAYGVRSPADAPALTSQGSDFLSLFLSPVKTGHMAG